MKSGAIKFAVVLVVLSVGAWGWAQEQDSQQQPDSDQVLEEMLGEVKQSPVIEPTQQPIGGPSAPTVLTDARLLGVAPKLKNQPLRPEGELVISRTGRIMQVAEAELPIFVFDADSAASPEAPLFLMPSQMTQDMQRMNRDAGTEGVAFVITGQIFTYNGGNYLLPTMMKVAVDKGNLQ